MLGFLLGGIGPRRESAELHERIDSLTEDLIEAQRNARPRSMRYMPLPGMDALAQSAPTPARTPRQRVTVETMEPESTPGDTPTPSPTPFDMQAFDAAVTAQRLRARQSRAALMEQADLNASEMATIDDVVAQMNDALAAYADELLAIAQSGEDPDALKLLGLSHDVTGILYDSQAAFEDIVGPDGLANTEESARQVWNYVDLEGFRDAVADMQEQNP